MILAAQKRKEYFQWVNLDWNGLPWLVWYFGSPNFMRISPECVRKCCFPIKCDFKSDQLLRLQIPYCSQYVLPFSKHTLTRVHPKYPVAMWYYHLFVSIISTGQAKQKNLMWSQKSRYLLLFQSHSIHPIASVVPVLYPVFHFSNACLDSSVSS